MGELQAQIVVQLSKQVWADRLVAFGWNVLWVLQKRLQEVQQKHFVFSPVGKQPGVLLSSFMFDKQQPTRAKIADVLQFCVLFEEITAFLL